VVWFLIRGWMVGALGIVRTEIERARRKDNAEAQSTQRNAEEEEPKGREKRVSDAGS